MIFLIYTLLQEIPIASWTKCRCGVLPVIIHVFGQVLTPIIEMLIAIVMLDIIFGGLFPTDAKMILSDYLAGGLAVLVPGTTLLVAGLIYTDVMVEI